jgi:hypothetical protein
VPYADQQRRLPAGRFELVLSMEGKLCVEYGAGDPLRPHRSPPEVHFETVGQTLLGLPPEGRMFR